MFEEMNNKEIMKRVNGGRIFYYSGREMEQGEITEGGVETIVGADGAVIRVAAVTSSAPVIVGGAAILGLASGIVTGDAAWDALHD